MAAQIRSGHYAFATAYEYVQQLAMQMLKDGFLQADDSFLSTLAIKIIDEHNGDITVQEFCQEMNTFLMPGNHVNWNKVVTELDLGPYRITENYAYFEGDERRHRITKSQWQDIDEQYHQVFLQDPELNLP